MTREEAWTRFAAEALGQHMVGASQLHTDQRTEMAAQWADAMTREWEKRFPPSDPAEPIAIGRKRKVV